MTLTRSFGLGDTPPEFAVYGPQTKVITAVKPQVNDRALPIYDFSGAGQALGSFTEDLCAIRGYGPHQFSEAAVNAAGLRMHLYLSATPLAAMFANVAPSDVNELQPSVQRGDFYAPQRSFTRPLASLVTSGLLSPVRPVTVPRFSASSGLVDDSRSPGDEPAAGTISTAGGSPISAASFAGKVEVDREIIDSGGSPQADAVIAAALRQAVDEVLEPRIVVPMDALSLSAVDVTGTDMEVVTGLRALVGDRRFTRGGMQLTSFAGNADLYGAALAAVGEAGPMLPVVDDTTGDIDGIGRRLRPCWALGDHSYLFDPAAVVQLATVRDLQFSEVKVSSVTIGIFGYSLEFIADPAGVVRVDYATS